MADDGERLAKRVVKAFDAGAGTWATLVITPETEENMVPGNDSDK